MAPSTHIQDEVYHASISDPEAFWSAQAEHLHWHTPPTRALSTTAKPLPNGVTHPHWSWFPGGEISNCYNCVDRHVIAGNGDDVAIIWDSPVSGNKEKYTYGDVLREVETLAGVLREEGVRRGDVVLIYSMPPPFILSMLIAWCLEGRSRKMQSGQVSAYDMYVTVANTIAKQCQ
jgi:propionyl-CoA synthetase